MRKMSGYFGCPAPGNVGPGRHDACVASTIRLDRAALTDILDRQTDVITKTQARAVGVTDGALRHRLRPGGPWRVLLPTVYLAATGTPSLA
jgi:hypothetical protein